MGFWLLTHQPTWRSWESLAQTGVRSCVSATASASNSSGMLCRDNGLLKDGKPTDTCQQRELIT